MEEMKEVDTEEIAAATLMRKKALEEGHTSLWQKYVSACPLCKSLKSLVKNRIESRVSPTHPFSSI